MGLELFTTEEIIKELHQRSTFVGIIVHSGSEHKTDNQVHDNWQIFDRTGGQTIELFRFIIRQHELGNIQKAVD